MWRQRLSIRRIPVGWRSTAGKSRTPAEKTRAPAVGLVVRHLGVEPRPEQVRDQREHLRSRRRERRRRVDLDPEAADLLAQRVAVLEPRAVEEPGRDGDVGDEERPLARPVVVGPVLDTEETHLGPLQRAPLRDASERLAALLDLPEEVVGGEEDEAAAEVAVALDDVVGALRHVLAVAREDDEVVGLPQLVAARERRRGRRRRRRRGRDASSRASGGTGSRSGRTAAGRPGRGTAGRARPAARPPAYQVSPQPSPSES